MVTKNISMRFEHSPIKTVGGDRENAQNLQSAKSVVGIGISLAMDFDLLAYDSTVVKNYNSYFSL